VALLTASPSPIFLLVPGWTRLLRDPTLAGATKGSPEEAVVAEAVAVDTVANVEDKAIDEPATGPVSLHSGHWLPSWHWVRV
jgi:hypothetical protein